MPDTPLPARAVDSLALARIGRRLAGAAQAPWLHLEAAQRMAQRLPYIKLKPQRVLDWHAFAGASHEHLASHYAKAQYVQVEAWAERLPKRAAGVPWWSAERWRKAPPTILSPRQVGVGSADLLWANMSLHLLPDPQKVFATWHAALDVDGFLMFSTLGPGTLINLQGLYSRLGWGPAFAPFVDMHDLGDMLVQAGFADPVMDQETVNLTWASPEAALMELRQLGGNAHPARQNGLRGKQWRQTLLGSLETLRQQDGRLALPFELVYGHAFKALPRLRVEGTTHVAVEDLRRMARAQRKP